MSTVTLKEAFEILSQKKACTSIDLLQDVVAECLQKIKDSALNRRYIWIFKYIFSVLQPLLIWYSRYGFLIYRYFNYGIFITFTILAEVFPYLYMKWSSIHCTIFLAFLAHFSTLLLTISVRNIPYFWNLKTQVVLAFFISWYIIFLLNVLVYVDIDLGHSLGKK